MLNGDRVVLRGVERGDLPTLWELSNDLEVLHRANDTRPLPTSLARLEAQFDARAATPEADLVRFVVTVDDAVVGQCLLYSFDTYAQACYLGVMLLRDRWGQGHGSDAVRTLVR